MDVWGEGCGVSGMCVACVRGERWGGRCGDVQGDGGRMCREGGCEGWAWRRRYKYIVREVGRGAGRMC